MATPLGISTAGVLWAKTNRANPVAWHPLPWHLLETAAVTRALWDLALPEAAKKRFADGLEISNLDLAGNIAAFWCGLHDLGKANPDFQTLDEEGKSRSQRAGFEYRHEASFSDGQLRHGIISAVTLPESAAHVFTADGRTLRRLALAVGGHHGLMATSDDFGRARRRLALCEAEMWGVARRQLVDLLVESLDLESKPQLTLPPLPVAIWLAGLASVADWIASDQEHFAYRGGESCTADHMDSAYQLACKTLESIGWIAKPDWSSQRTFSETFPFTPNPMQQAVVSTVSPLESAFLLVIEAPMGGGKTEAALWAAEHAISRLGLEGFYVAMPTQATSDQLFTRVREFLEQGPAADRITGVQLIHGHASLSSELESLSQTTFSPINPTTTELDADSISGGVVAASWFKGRKRALLSPVGVGTIDQALLAILQSRHYFVRLHGLSGKVVILDEVHAYDTYMTTLIDRLLTWLGALEVPVILLSATLPKDRREQLAAAYASGANWRGVLATDEDYPRITLVHREGTVAKQIPSDESSKRIALRTWNHSAPDWAAIGSALSGTLEDGGCAVVICTTVREAQSAFTALRQTFPDDELELFHARFRHLERMQRQERVLCKFGKPGKSVRPHRRILVATQVVEQSLDIDFDLLVTRFAPVDLLLQRMGRLHRHSRPHRPLKVASPECWLVGPGGAESGVEFDAASTAVYDEHVLLRTWLALRDRQELELPTDIEPLVESVYGPPRPSDIAHAAWNRTLSDHEQEHERHEGLARRNAVAHPYASGMAEPLFATSLDLNDDDAETGPAAQALTRLGDIRLTTVVLKAQEARSVPKGPNYSSAEIRWFLERSIPISGRREVADLLATPQPVGWDRTAMLRHCRLVVLDQEDRANLRHTVLHLDDRLGLRTGASN